MAINYAQLVADQERQEQARLQQEQAARAEYEQKLAAENAERQQTLRFQSEQDRARAENEAGARNNTRAEEERRRQEAARGEEERSQNERANQDRRRTEALYRGNTYADIRNRGAGVDDTHGIGDYYRELYNRSVSALPEGTDIDAAINPETLYNTAYNDVRSGVRRRLTGQANELAGENYGQTAIGDDADDAIIDSILGTQRTQANDAIERARSRGMLNDAGYAAATTGLGNATTTARARLNETGQGVLQRYRDTVNETASGIRNRATNYDFGDTFDIDKEVGTLGAKATSLKGNLEGDLRSAVGNTNYFDTGQLLGTAGQQQGFVNPGGNGNPLTAAFNTTELDAGRDNSRRRLVGSTGAF